VIEEVTYPTAPVLVTEGDSWFDYDFTARFLDAGGRDQPVHEVLDVMEHEPKRALRDHLVQPRMDPLDASHRRFLPVDRVIRRGKPSR
jgi:hypothetical protein